MAKHTFKVWNEQGKYMTDIPQGSIQDNCQLPTYTQNARVYRHGPWQLHYASRSSQGRSRYSYVNDNRRYC